MPSFLQLLLWRQRQRGRVASHGAVRGAGRRGEFFSSVLGCFLCRVHGAAAARLCHPVCEARCFLFGACRGHHPLCMCEAVLLA